MILGGATKDANTEARQQRPHGAWPRAWASATDVALLGFMPNPYAFMARRGVFALSLGLGGLRQRAGRGHGLRLPGGQHRLPLRPGARSWTAAATARWCRWATRRRSPQRWRGCSATPPDPALLRRRSEDFTVARSVDGYLQALFGAMTRARASAAGCSPTRGSPCSCRTSPAAASSGPPSASPQGFSSAACRSTWSCAGSAGRCSPRCPPAVRVVPLRAGADAAGPAAGGARRPGRHRRT